MISLKSNKSNTRNSNKSNKTKQFFFPSVQVTMKSVIELQVVFLCFLAFSFSNVDATQRNVRRTAGAGCAATTCVIDTECVEDSNGVATCKCRNGFTWNEQGTECIPMSGSCATIRCMSGFTCVNDSKGKGSCVPDPITTQASCAAMLCPINTNCIETDGVGACVCMEGYRPKLNGQCMIKRASCAVMKCVTNTTCTENTFGEGKCRCATNYRLNITTNQCDYQPPCAAITCPENSNCVTTTWGAGKCTCNTGYKRTFPNRLCAKVKKETMPHS